MTQVVNMEDIDLFHKRRRKHKTRKGLTFSDSETESDNNSLSEESKDNVSGNVKTTRKQREKRTKNEDSTDESEDEREISSDLDEDEELEDDFWNQARSIGSVPYEPCNFGKDLDIGLPVGMITNMADLFGLFNMDTWRTKLTEEERTLLKGLLPPLPKESDLDTVIEELFSNKNFFFGNPITKFFKDLQSGIYHAQVVPYRQNALALRKADYKHDLRLYVAKLVQAVMNYKMEMGLKDYKELSTEGAQDAIQITADMINNEEVSTDDGSGDDDSTKPMEKDKAGKFESDTDTEPEPDEPKKILKGPALEPKEPRIRLPLFFVFRTIRDFFLQFSNKKASQEYIFEKLGSSTYDDVHTQIPPNFTTSQFFSLALKFLAKHPAAPASNSGSRKPIVEWNAHEQTWAWNAVGHDSSDDHLQSLEILFFFAVYRSPGEDFPHLKSLTREKRSVVTIVRTPATLIPQFQQQERKRYETPDKPFVFTVGGTRSIVAPLKRVPNQPADKSKARDHKALKADRPSFVTLLTLVRDAASRLPGGAGTRADVELLLRDSQYLLPDQPETDQREESLVKNLRDLVLHQKDGFQEVLSSKVSNALDRLKKDKDDPCVQFDDNSKLWVYLHRNRRKGDFVSVPVTCRKKSSS